MPRRSAAQIRAQKIASLASARARTSKAPIGNIGQKQKDWHKGFEGSGEIGRIQSSSVRRPSTVLKERIDAGKNDPNTKRRYRDAKRDEAHVIARHPFAGQHPERAASREIAGLSSVPDLDAEAAAAQKPKTVRKKRT